MNFSITPEIFAEWCRPIIHKDTTGKIIGYATSCSLAIGGQLPQYLPSWTSWDTGFRESVDGWYFHPVMQDGDFSLDDLAHGASIIAELQKG